MTRAIAFVGSCQVAGLAAAARRLLPGTDVRAIHVGATMPAAAVPAALAGVEAVVTGVGDRAPDGGLIGPAALSAGGRRTAFLPTFVFHGLHPDMIYLADGARMIAGPLSDYHSALAAACFLLDVPAGRAARLFNARVFAAIGYLAYSTHRQATIAAYARHGYDLAPAFASWEAGAAPFLHTINHPRPPVLSWLATMALRRLELVDAAAAPPADVEDTLASGVIAPVFPAIARQAGWDGGETYLSGAAAADVAIAARAMPLAEMVARSYAIFGTLDAALLETPVVTPIADALERLLVPPVYAPPRRSLASPAAI